MKRWGWVFVPKEYMEQCRLLFSNCYVKFYCLKLVCVEMNDTS